ncbi:MAG: DNA primase [Gemmataceae bacterium]|nr:DNA primase [Gemmataceae bacterium]
MAEDRLTLIQRVKQANDIVDVVGGYLVLRPAGPTFKGLCPFHDDHRPSFDVDPRRQRYRCWSCNKYGDVLSFVQEQERISFNEALELLAKRAGISLEKWGNPAHDQGRARMLEAMQWAAEQFQLCLLDSDDAEPARHYLGQRQLNGETVRRFGVGYAPLAGEWLVGLAREAGLSLETLEKVGLIARRNSGNGYYDRFRDRVMFPIRDVRGQTVAFGGRLMPGSPQPRAPKYYNSCETPLFTKSEQIYGLDLARTHASKAGYLAVFEGYTDVLMAHQMGIPQVVATMGTALNVRHVAQLRRFAPRVILVFDSDAGGDTGVDRALEIFVGQDVDLKVATLPEGLDPCDLLVQQGPEPLQAALTNSVDVLEFKLGRVLATTDSGSVETRRQAIDAVLGIIALAPPLPGQSGAVKQELMVTRIAQRFGLREETVWARLRELRAARRGGDKDMRHPAPSPGPAAPRSAPASPLERELLTLLLADPALVPVACAELPAKDVQHPGLRLLLEGLYRLQAEGGVPDLDRLRPRIENAALLARAMELQEVGLMIPDRARALRELLTEFRTRRALSEKQELRNQLQAASDDATALELLRRLQERMGG